MHKRIDILGCTEIPLLASEGDVGLPLFDTTTIHADAALRFAVGNQSEKETR